MESLRETEGMVRSTFIGIGQMINGTRDSDELGGPIRIAKGAGEAAQLGLSSVVFYTILLSLNLGLINLFPIPVLDGGHLVFYAFEAVLGRPLGERAQEYSFRVGLFLVLALMVFATRNDIVALPVWQVVKQLFS
jgi:regulator of sigma E protease